MDTSDRDDAIDRGYENAREQFKKAALVAVYEAAHRFEEFTTDDLVIDATTHDLRALGGVMREAANRGWIVRTDRTATSSSSTCHNRPKRIWKRGPQIALRREQGTLF